MRLSLLVSILVHCILFLALVYLFKAVPDMDLPKKVYSVKILQPIIGKKQEEPEVKTEVKKETPPPSKPKPEKKDEPKKEEAKKPPEQAKEEKPLDVSVDQQDAPSALTVDAPRFPFSYYLAAIERKVSQNWFSSSSGKGEGYSCVVYFRMNRNGSVSDLKIEESSGNSYFDRSALRAIRSSDPFPPLPRAFTDPWLGIHFTFIQRD